MKTLLKAIVAIIVVVILAVAAVVIVRGLHTPNNEVVLASNEAAIENEVARQMLALQQPTQQCPECRCECPVCPEAAVAAEVVTAEAEVAEAVEAEATVVPAFVPEKKTDQVNFPKFTNADGTIHVYYYGWQMSKALMASGFAALPQYQSANGYLVGRQARQWLYRSIEDRYILINVTYVTYEEGLSLVDIVDGITVDGPNDSFAVAVEDVTREGNVLVAQLWFSETSESHWDIIRRAEGELVVAVPHYAGITRPAPRRTTTVVVNNNNGGNGGHGGEQPQPQPIDVDPTPVWEDPEVPTPEPTQQPTQDWDPSFNWPTEEPQPQPTQEPTEWDPSFNWNQDPEPIWEPVTDPITDPVSPEDWSEDFNFESSSDTDPAPVWEGASEPVSEPVAAEDWSGDFNFGDSTNSDPAPLWD